MKSNPPNVSPNSKHIGFEIFYSQVSKKDIQLIQNALETTYLNILVIITRGVLKPPKEAYNSKRDQYNADILLSYLLKTKKTDTALWVIQNDLFSRGMNFIFGKAMYRRGAILSINRLFTKDLIEKEAIHEVGHILGLKHCRNRCVMQFSISLWKAKMKPSYLCENCKRRITFL